MSLKSQKIVQKCAKHTNFNENVSSKKCKAEKEALAKKLNEGLLKRKEGANLAMQFLTNVYARETRVGDTIVRIKDEQMFKAE